MIKYLRIQDWFCIYTAICDRSVCSSHFDIIYTSCDTTQSSCLRNVCHTREIFIISIYQSRKAKVQQFIITGLFTDRSQRLYSTDIDGMFDRVADCGLTRILIVPVVGFVAVFIGKRSLIVDHGCKSIPCAVDRGSIGGKHLETGTRLSGRISGTVERKTGCFFSAAANDRFYFSGILIHQNDRSLRLRGNIDPFVHGILLRDIQSAFIFRDCAVYFLFRIKDKRIFTSPGRGDIVSQHFFTVILHCTIRPVDRQSIIKTIFPYTEIVSYICNLFITDLLYSRILGCSDRKAATV
ncbi:Uncharacterised protein [uncultured Clostridium sp.]|nr:Uncharacterised protein [uncultured Clostridium sp.]